MNFERVKREEADTVLKLYRSLLGTPYCVWTEEYPSEKEVEFDLSRDALLYAGRCGKYRRCDLH